MPKAVASGYSIPLYTRPSADLRAELAQYKELARTALVDDCQSAKDVDMDREGYRCVGVCQYSVSTEILVELAQAKVRIAELQEVATDNFNRAVAAETALATLRAQASPDAVETLGKAAVDFINSYQDHIGRCRACDTAWQNLRIAVQNALKDSHGR
jgi:hypothetical protein